MANSQSKPHTLPGMMSLKVEALTQQLQQFADQYNIQTWCLAYSGGVDSQVLLHLLHLTSLKITAVYIDHGLQDASREWASHCQHQCELLDVPFQVIRVNAQPEKGESPEAAARTARYDALEKIIKKNDCLLTAQHLNDQAETVMLQLLRGGGAAGVSAMPVMSAFSRGRHCRPLLNVSQQAILDYAEANHLCWVEDPTNQQQNYDRNYLRHSVMPALYERWPASSKTLSIFAQQQAENVQLLEQLAVIDLLNIQQSDNSLDITKLVELDDARLRNAFRYWIKTSKSPMPSRSVLSQIIQQMLVDTHDTKAVVSWASVEVRRFKERLYLLNKVQHDASQKLLWDGKNQIELASIDKRIEFKICQTGNDIDFVLRSDILQMTLSIRFRQGGERIQPAGRKGHHDLKSLFQEASVPVWQRDKIPLLYAGEDLLAVVGYWLAGDFAIKGEGILPVLN